MRKLLFGILIAAIISGCAFSNEGKVDYRRTDNRKFFIPENHSDKSITCTNPACVNTTCKEEDDCKGNLQKFVAKNYSLGDDAKFRIGESLSLHLRTAYIKEFSEEWLSSIVTKAFTSHWGKEDGELVIIANAFEEVDGKELDFKDMQAGRVVFFSDDVHEGQFLNFNNMPIYGPLTYKGAPFAFRISILELDVVSEQTKAMLNMLAKAGAMAYPPASPVLGVLNGLGGSIMDGPQTDTGFRYTMVLDPKGGSKNINHLALEVGNYALVRVENRNDFVDWNNIILNENEGMLYKKDEEGKMIKYTDSTYLIVEINKDVSNLNVELSENNFSSLLAFLQEKDKQRAADWNQTKDAVMNVAIKRFQIVNFSSAKEIIKTLNKTDNKVSKAQKRIKTEKLLTMIGNSLDSNGKVVSIDPKDVTKNYDLSESQITLFTR